MKMFRMAGFVAALIAGAMGIAKAEVDVLPGTVSKAISVGQEVKKADHKLTFVVPKNDADNASYAGCAITLDVEFDADLWRVMGGEGEARCGNRKITVGGVLVADDNSIGIEVSCEKQSACFHGATNCGFGECRVGKLQAGKQLRFALTDATERQDESQYDKSKLAKAKDLPPRQVEMKTMQPQLPFVPMSGADMASAK